MSKKTDSLQYEGIVILSIINDKTKKIKSKQVVHNNGTSSLFYFLCSCLTKSYDKNYTPAAIDAYKNIYEYGKGQELKSSLAYRILLSNQGVIKDFKVDLDGGKKLNYDYVARFSAIIPYSALNGTNTIQNLQLHYSSSSVDTTSSLLAYINLASSVEIEEGESLLVEWNMGFLNPATLNISEPTS